MPVSLPVIFQRDLEKLLRLTDAQLGTAAHREMPVYGFIILRVQPGADGTLLTITRSGITLDVQHGRVAPAKKVG